jgi:hypothetical protein
MNDTTAINTGATVASYQRHFFILADDWTWWAWTLTATLLAIGLAGYPSAFITAMAITALQAIAQMRWLYWLPTLGTFALVIFGYCLLARALYLLPWNRQESLSADLLRRTFMTRPDLSRVSVNPQTAGCAGGLCTIEAQVGRKRA